MQTKTTERHQFSPPRLAKLATFYSTLLNSHPYCISPSNIDFTYSCDWQCIRHTESGDSTRGGKFICFDHYHILKHLEQYGRPSINIYWINKLKKRALQVRMKTDTPTREDKLTTSISIISMHSVSSKVEHTLTSTSQKKCMRLTIKRLVLAGVWQQSS